MRWMLLGKCVLPSPPSLDPLRSKDTEFPNSHPLLMTRNTDPVSLAIILLLTGTIASSSGPIFVKFSELEIGPFATIFNRFWMTILGLGLWMVIDFWLQIQTRTQTQNQNDRPEGNESSPELFIAPFLRFPANRWPWLVLAGGALAANLLLAAWALTQTKVANITILDNCSPLFASTGAWLLWRKQFDNRFKLGMVLALLGAFLIGAGDFQISPAHATGDLAAVLAAASFSVYLLCVERLHEYLSTLAILWGSSIVAALCSFLVMACLEPEWFPLSSQGWLAIVGLAFICQIMGQGLVAYSLKRISAGAVATTFLLEPVFPALAAWWLFAEHLSLSNALAFGVVAVGIYLAVSSPSALGTGEGAGGVLLDPVSADPRLQQETMQEDQTP